MSRKNILLIIPELGQGGAERAFSKLSLLLAKRYNLYILTFNKNIKQEYDVGGTHLSLDVHPSNNYLEKSLNFFKRITKTRKIKLRYQIDFSISFLEGANYVNVLSRAKEKVVISQRGSISYDLDIKGVVGKIRKGVLIPYIYKGADHIVALSEGLKHELIAKFKIQDNKISVIYNHYNLDIISQIASQKIDVKKKKIFCNSTIVTLGRLHIQKGHKGLIEVFNSILRKHNTPNRLVIFGDGVLRNDLIRQSIDLGLKVYSVWSGDKISENYDLYFMGYVKDPYKYISKCGAFVFPSIYEGLGNSIVEALGCGIPIIATDCHSGPREIISPNTRSNYNLDLAEYSQYGILMPEITSNEGKDIWGKTIHNIIQNHELNIKYSTIGGQRILDFDEETISQQWINLLDNAL